MGQVRWIAAFAIFVAIALFSHKPAESQTAVQKVEKDELFFVKSSDPDMAGAMREARASLSEFLAITAVPNKSITNFALKIGVREGDETEYLWINPFKQTKNAFIGIVNNTPRTLKTIRYKDQIEFPERDIVDWMYVENGKVIGNYTGCVILKKLPKSEQAALQKKIKLDCR